MSDPRLKMQDPRSQYPQPPFKPQQQNQPRPPDHGETTYVGTGRPHPSEHVQLEQHPAA